MNGKRPPAKSGTNIMMSEGVGPDKSTSPKTSCSKNWIAKCTAVAKTIATVMEGIIIEQPESPCSQPFLRTNFGCKNSGCTRVSTSLSAGDDSCLGEGTSKSLLSQPGNAHCPLLSQHWRWWGKLHFAQVTVSSWPSSFLHAWQIFSLFDVCWRLSFCIFMDYLLLRASCDCSLALCARCKRRRRAIFHLCIYT